MRAQYIPDRGDIVWVNFSPRRGHEQKGKRPAFVLTVRHYNERSGLAMICPVTSRRKGYPFEIEFEIAGIGGVILVDQIISIDWIERKVKFAGRVTPSVVTEVQEKATVLINDTH